MRRPSSIHPTAIVDDRVQCGEGVRIAAYSVITGPVKIGAGTVIQEHCVIRGTTEIGRGCNIGPGAYLGMDPQHLQFKPDGAEPTWLLIGDEVVVREGARIHRSTRPGRDHATRVGDHCYLMGAIHVAHDCVLGPHVILADGVLLGGHCEIGERTFLGGGCTIHQFVRMGRLCIIAGNEAISQDVPPFGAARYGRLKGYNAVGCRRAGLDRSALTAIRAAYFRIRNHRTTSAALAAIRSEVPDVPEVREIVEFIESSRRGTLSSHKGLRDSSRFSAATENAAEAGE